MFLENLITILLSIFASIIAISIMLKNTGITESYFELLKYKKVTADKKLEDETQKALFDRKYYRDISNEEVVNLLKEMAKIIFDPNNNYSVKPQRELLENESIDEVLQEQRINVFINIFLYCSARTIKLYAEFMQFIYNDGHTNNPTENMFLVALIIANIKYDYSNNFTSPIDILRMKIKDIKDFEDNLSIYLDKYSEYVFL